MDYGRPGLVQALVPDGCRKGREFNGARVSADRVDVLGGLLLDGAHALVVDGFAGGRDNKVHFMYEDVDLGGGRVLEEGGQDGHVGCQVAVYVARFNVENVDEDADVGEDVDALLREVVLHEGFLAAAVPEIEGEVAEEFYVGEVDVDGSAAVGEVDFDLVTELKG